MELSGKSCLVAGGAGFIGSALVSELLKRNCRVQVIDDFSTGNRKNLRHVENHHSLSIVSGTILNTELLDSLMANAEFIFNLACLGVRHSLSQPVENHLVNSEGALQLLIAARKAGIKRFIHCSSSEVYGTTTSGCIAENHPTLPHTVYGASKLSGEAYARAFYRT